MSTQAPCEIGMFFDEVILTFRLEEIVKFMFMWLYILCLY